MPKKSQRKCTTQVQDNEVKHKWREDGEVLKGPIHWR